MPPLFRLFLTGALVGVAACSSPSEPRGLPATVQLAIGETAAVAGTATRITFLGIPADSRCPSESGCLILCFWEGDAAAELQVVSNGAELGRPVVHTSDKIGPREATLAGLRVTLASVEPSMPCDGPIPPESYRVTLAIEKAA